MSRRLPVPTELSSAFWISAAGHRLAIPCCGNCGEHFFPPERLCPACGSTSWGYVESTGSGTVTSYTVVHRAPSPDFEVPYVIAVVELDEGCSMLTNLVHTDPESVSTGMSVELTFLDQPDGRALPVFAPDPGAHPDEPEKG
ncbi:MAG: uncharacterized protein QOH37_1812 [Nocardioidaceae bacterium]|jgi:uncharacterized OB-fold protein|nr:uncharacterized protein [Nocardioidaceae bacterium]